ncbi:hypothetical protein MMH89_02775 [Candidatus Comchoanobacter bicostacola]|uniref:DNA-directed DNA polymerase n=1 Tax=Candidatus Comchoanobacter bicostacola TaxID=2919598 RepID=A0ABY5DK18_9GAMM|nr:hypothetical protein [Candidatus Comchoanobacter bicostacola]UTC24147.1 hypothetical protein MMH89_02775 [Candidatus Comchoanobacter bicostacola]
MSRISEQSLLDRVLTDNIDELPTGVLCSGLQYSDQNQLINKIRTALLAKGHQDLYVFASEDNRSIAIDQVRVLVDRLSRVAVSGCHWVIISGVDYMHVSAANALLKILEEPPGKTHFILFSASENRVLNTIRSRVQKLYINRAGVSLSSQREELISKLVSIMHSENIFCSVHAEIEDGHDAISALMELINRMIVSGSHDKLLWKYYDELLSVYRLNAQRSCMNHSMLLDRVALILQYCANHQSCRAYQAA